MIKFFYKNEVLVVFTILIIIFCQLFFKRYANVLDDFEKEKNYVVYSVQYLKYQDSHILRYFKDYAVEYIDKIAPMEKDTSKLVTKISDNEYMATNEANLNGEFYGYFDESLLDDFHSEIDFSISLDRKFREITKKHDSIENIYYKSINGFEYKWPKTSSSSLNHKYNSENYVVSQNDDDRDSTSDLVDIHINVFDKANKYYGTVGYSYYPKNIYSFLDNSYPCVIKDENNNIVYTNSKNAFTNEEISQLDTVFTAYKQAENKGEILVYDNKYYYLYSFDDGTTLLQYLKVSKVLKKAFVSTLPIILVGLTYGIFLLFKSNYEQSTDELNRAIEELDESYVQLKNMANTDFLTNLNNRAGLTSAIGEYLHRYSNAVFVMADIDKFKSVNDTYGHEIGDVVLKEFANLLKESITEKDIVARWGGEEFVIAMMDVTEDEAFYLVEAIREKIMQLEIVTEEQGTFHISASFGVATHKFKDFMIAVNRADEALYYSKNNGRNRVTKYSDLAF